MKEIIQSLEKISKLAAAQAADVKELEKAISAARDAIKKNEKDSRLETLDGELSIWQSKLSVIVKEPIGRQGISKHCLHWVGKLK